MRADSSTNITKVSLVQLATGPLAAIPDRT